MTKLNVWIKVEDYFIRESNIRALKRYGNQTIIERYEGENIVVSVPYEKIEKLLTEEK